MLSVNFQTESIHLRANIDLEEIHRRSRTEYGSGCEVEISRVLADVDKDLDDCDSEISRLQSHIIFLQNHRQRLEEYRGCWEPLRSPIRRQPNEIILRIFDLVCDMNELTSKKLQKMPALAISGVCFRWRTLATSCPKLWSRISIQIWATPRHLAGLPILDLFLDSSRQSPLIIEFPFIKYPKALESEHIAVVCAAICACSNRWYRLTVCGWMIYDAIVAHNPSNFPLLEHLALPNLVDSTGWRAATLDRYQNAPKLHTLAFGGVPPINKDLDLWTRLTLLDVAQCNSKLKDVFEICSNLRELRFRQFETGLPIKLCSPPISAPFVEKLTLSLTQTFYAESGGLANVIFASITCPSLTSLFIEGLTGYEDKWPRDAVNDFISRSTFRLTTLSIKFVPLLDSDLIDFLHRLPSLVHLTVDDSNIPTNSPSPITSAFVQSLHAFPPTNSATNSSVLMKSLKTLSLTFGGPGTFNDREFVDMVLSRWFSSTYADGYGPNTSNVRTTCLRSVVMRFTRRDVDQGIYRQLKYLSKEGMRVVVVGQAKT